MTKSKILLQIDGDKHASVFDSVVAVDAGVEQLFTRSDVEPTEVTPLVHGTIFTRGMDDLKSTAIFVGGSNVAAGEELLRQVKKSFFGPMRVSVMLDANGANTTAAAAVLAAARHIDLAGKTGLVLAGTGPVGQRIARLLLKAGASVLLASRSVEKAEAVKTALLKQYPTGVVTPVAPGSDAELSELIKQADALFAAGAAGIQLASIGARESSSRLKVAVDLNAVPPLGLEGIEVFDKGVERNGQYCYGAIGVGGTKMKIHKEAIRRLFSQNNLVLDAEEIFEIGRELEKNG